MVHVEDQLGFANGVWRIEAAEDSTCRVTPAADTEAEIELGVSELSSLYLGGVSALSLAEAGRLQGRTAAVVRLDAALRTERAPHLNVDY